MSFCINFKSTIVVSHELETSGNDDEAVRVAGGEILVPGRSSNHLVYAHKRFSKVGTSGCLSFVLRNPIHEIDDTWLQITLRHEDKEAVRTSARICSFTA